MRRLLIASVVAIASAALFVACGGSTPGSPTPGGNGGGGGGVITPPPNTPPVVKSIVAADTRVEVGTPVTLTATVEDLETPVANLTYAWTADNGTFSGTGAMVTWTPGAAAKTPGDFVLTLTVTEKYTSGSTEAENKATGTVTVHVNNSPKELQELSLRFLGDFANSKISAEKCVSEFSDATSKCADGKKDELEDVRRNRHDYEMIGSTLRHTSLSITSSRMNATVHTFCSFTVKVISADPLDIVCQGGKCPLGSQGTATGDCWTTNVYEQGRWWLCESHFTGLPTLTQPTTFVPTIFRNRGF
ncbi:MAG TPA: PKD domain-containing protein [Vicinamibacterales bacterium]|nr:PKD domain-containing protein [Vicinamibacterales bacterium]